MIRNLIRHLIQNQQPNIAVVGDCILDEYYQVETNRISPEAPIPVFLSSNFQPHLSVPGGAANVARQVKALTGNVSLFGLVDEGMASVMSQYDLSACGCSYLTTTSILGEFVPRKQRFYCGEQPLFRRDIEQPQYGSGSGLLKHMGRIEEHFNKYPVVVYSDYNKGIFDFFRLRDQDNTITIVDPKKDIKKWKGCTVIKPNAKEARELTGADNWQDQCRVFHQITGCKSVVITQEGRGFVGSTGGDFFEYKSPTQVQPVCVNGAGDCFIAVLAVAMSNGFEIQQAAQIAFSAAQIYVGRRYNQPVSVQDMADAFEFDMPLPKKQRDYKLVFTNGCFDCLGPHHIKLLEYAKSQGDRLVVAINTDESVALLKGAGRPYYKLEDRVDMLRSLSCVDYIIAFAGDTPIELIKCLEPEIIVKGGDYKPEEVVGGSLAEVKIFPLMEGYSTSKLLGDKK